MKSANYWTRVALQAAKQPKLPKATPLHHSSPGLRARQQLMRQGQHLQTLTRPVLRRKAGAEASGNGRPGHVRASGRKAALMRWRYQDRRNALLPRTGGVRLPLKLLHPAGEEAQGHKQVTSRAVGYVRVSTQEQAKKGLSLSEQREQIERLAAIHDLELVEVFADEGVSASKPNTRRLSYLRMMERIREGDIGCAISYRVDRFDRKMRTSIEAACHLIDDLGVRILSTDVDTAQPGGRQALYFAMMMAEQKSRNLGPADSRHAFRCVLEAWAALRRVSSLRARWRRKPH